MVATFILNADELDEQFLQGLRQTFAHRQIEISVRESDETAYLLRSPANRQHLQEALADVEAGRNVVVPDQTAFQFATRGAWRALVSSASWIEDEERLLVISCRYHDE